MNERELRTLRAVANELRALRQEIHAIHEDQQANNNADNHDVVQPLRVEIAEAPNLGPTWREYYEAENRDRNSIWRKLKPWAEGIGIGIGFALAIFTLLNLLEIKQQTIIAEQQSRPWIKVTEVRLNSPETLTFNNPRMMIVPGETLMLFSPTVKDPIARADIRTEFRLKNIGKSVAQNIEVIAELFFVPSGFSIDLVQSEQERFCGQEGTKDHGPLSSRSALFP